MNGFLGVEDGNGDSKARDKTAQANEPAGELRTGPGISHHVTPAIKQPPPASLVVSLTLDDLVSAIDI